MAKVILLSVAICVLSIQSSLSASQADIHKISESQGMNPNIVQLASSDYKAVTIDKNILTVSSSLKSSGNSNSNSRVCQLTIDPFEDRIIDKVRTMSFKQSIVVWGVRSVQEVDELKLVRYTMLIVDQEHCSYRPLTLPVDKVPINHATLSPELAIAPHPVYGMALNIFFPTLKTCAPCQYYPKDHSITKLEQQIEPPVMAPKSFHIQPFGEMNNQINNGYLFIYNYAIGTARVNYLDKNFKVVQSRYLYHTVDVTSIVNNAADRQNIAGCWYHNNDQIVCERFDSRLDTKASYYLDGDSVSIRFDKNENAFVSTAKKFGGVSLSIYDVFGQLVDKLNVGAVSRSAQNVEVDGFLDYNDRPAKEYCIVITELPKIRTAKASYYMKCIDVSKYTQMP